MPHYLIQASYTSEAWAAQIKNPVDRLAQVDEMMSAVGVKFVHGFYAFGEYDLVILAEGPDNKSAAAAAIAAAGGGALSRIHTTVLMESDEGVAAIKSAGEVGYTPPGS